MKKNYGISILLCTAILCALYAGSYQSMYAEDSQTEHTEELSIAPAEAGREKKLYQYCLKEKDGCVYVYFADGKTIYRTDQYFTGRASEKHSEENQKRAVPPGRPGTLQLPRKLQQLKSPAVWPDILCTVTNTADSAPTSRLPAPDIRTHHSS